jgi:3-methyl-2-oxobutanoate hydroxymethyltransferase
MTKIMPASLRKMKKRGERIAVLTCYDAATARLLNEAAVDVLLVGDSVGNVKLGHENTLPVTLDDMVHHARAVRRGNGRALLVADMPARTYERDAAAAARNARRLVKDGGADAVKLEGASPSILKSVKAILRAGVPVMGHVGLTPQSVERLGGYRVQGRDAAGAEAILDQARALEAAGVFAVVAEAVPGALGTALTRALKVPVIGIGAGPRCDGQVLVVDDLLGLTPAPRPRFVKAYAELREASARAVRAWRADVKAGRFPGPAQTY